MTKPAAEIPDASGEVSAGEPAPAPDPAGSFLPEPAVTPAAQALYDEDIADDGFVWNLTRLWAYQPETQQKLFELMGDAVSPGGLSKRQRGILVTATASTLGDSYCSLAWGGKLAKYADDPAIPAAVLTGTDEGLTEQEAAMAAWARLVARDPNSTTPADVERLRAVGFDDAQIFAITAFVALRIAFSTVNDALGARPDGRFVATLPPEVREAVDYGRRPLG